jgi:hypothetical protein
MSTSRLLTKEEKRLVADALRVAAKEARLAKSHALADRRFICSTTQASHIDELARRAGTADRLAAEVDQYELRLEKGIDTKKLREIHDAAPDTIETVTIDPGPGPASSCEEVVPAAANFYEAAHQSMAELLDEVEIYRDLANRTVDVLNNAGVLPHDVDDRELFIDERVRNLVDERNRIRRELAEQYPIAMLAREVSGWADDAASSALLELRQLIDNHAKQTEAAKLEYLPTRLRGGG